MVYEGLRLIGILLVQITVVKSEHTIRDRIKFHKAWLERRAAIKALEGADNSTRKLYYFNKLLNSKLNGLQSNSSLNYFKKQKKFKTHQNDVLDSDSTIDNVTHPTNIQPENSTINYSITTPFQLTSLGTASPDILIPVTLPTYDVNVTRENDFKNKKDKSPKTRRKHVIWSAWHPWSECSRTCGNGVMSQRRDCIRLLPNKNGSGNTTSIISKECIGLSKRYRLCSEQNCPDPDVDFRQLQCTLYNNQTFQGTKYEWEAYIKDDAECELNCKPVGLSYFATLNDRVVDGTPCFKPSDYLKLRRNHAGKAICVDGICKNTS